jgi:hypothetical protein
MGFQDSGRILIEETIVCDEISGRVLSTQTFKNKVYEHTMPLFGSLTILCLVSALRLLKGLSLIREARLVKSLIALEK